MAKVYTEKFAEKIDERFSPTTVTHAATNNDYDFVGAKTVKVTSINTVALGDYDRDKGYGAAKTIDNTSSRINYEKRQIF